MKKRLHPIKARAQRRAHVEQSPQEFRYGWIGPRAAIRHLDLGSQSALYRLIKEWELPYGRMGRLYRFRRDHLDEWLLRRGPTAFAALEARESA